jgi:antitoxin component YwqK of YwqJK toxin-antitoxin module
MCSTQHTVQPIKLSEVYEAHHLLHIPIPLVIINKMRYLILILIFLNIIKVSGQEAYDNFIDSRGQKQGKWIYEKIDTCNKSYISKCIYQEGNYSNNQKIGVWKYYRCLGNPCNMKQLLEYEIHHINDFVFDTLRKYDGSEQMKLTFIKEKYQSDAIRTQHSDYTIGPSGELKVSILNGILKTYYDNGILKSEFEFINNKPVGKFKCFYENGKIRYDGEITPESDYARIKEYYFTGAFKIEKNFLLETLLKEWTYYNELQ